MRVSASDYISSNSARFPVREIARHLGRADLIEVLCQRCAEQQPGVLSSPSEVPIYVAGTAAMGVMLSVIVVVVIAYPRSPESAWRWQEFMWPETGGGLLGVLGVLATILLAMGVDLSRQHDAMLRLRSPWRTGGSGLDLGEFRQARRVFDRADMAEVVLRMSSAAAFGVGALSLCKAVVLTHVESALTALVASIIILVGRAMLMHAVQDARGELGLTRVGAIVRAGRDRATAESWRLSLERARDARLLWPLAALALPIVLVMPACAVVSGSTLWRWSGFQLNSLLLVVVAAVLYAETVGLRRGPRIWGWTLVVLLVAPVYLAGLFLLAGRTFGWFGWPGLGYAMIIGVGSFVLALRAAFPSLPGGGGLIRWGARRLPRYRRASSLPAAIDPFYVVVSDAGDQHRLRSPTRPGAPRRPPGSRPSRRGSSGSA